jgi:hypothetical protein
VNRNERAEKDYESEKDIEQSNTAVWVHFILTIYTMYSLCWKSVAVALLIDRIKHVVHPSTQLFL